MSVTLTESQNNLLKSIAEKQNFHDFVTEWKTGAMKGDNYMGVINIVEIRDKKDPNRKLNLVVKFAGKDEKLREKVPVRRAYEREIYVYDTILPTLRELQEIKGVPEKFRFHETAQYFGSSMVEGEECLVLQNIRELGFQLWSRLEPMDSKHVSQVMKTYGKLHALSLALKALEPERYQQFEKNMVNVFATKDLYAGIKANVETMAKKARVAVLGNAKATENLDNFADKLFKFYQIRGSNLKYSALLHGDCWCNNMMFKYEDPEDSTNPTEVRLLDWQLSRAASIVDDLAYFMCTCASKKDLYAWEEHLRTYHKSMSEILTHCGLDPQEIIPFDGLVEEWKFHFKGGLFWGLLILKIMVSEVEQAPDISEGAQDGKDLIESLAGASSNENRYLDRIADVVIFMTDMDYF